MRLSHLTTSWRMTAMELLRNRMAIILLFLIPSLFYLIVALTTRERAIAFKLAALSNDVWITVSEKRESLVFIGLAAVGLITSFLALNLVQKHTAVNRRLILCGYHPAELIGAKLAVLLVLIILIGAYVALLLLFFFQPHHFFLTLGAFMLGGYVYGCYGLLIGSIFSRDLEGILFIVLLANIDAGWLQNPVYYAEAQHRWIIRCLPAFFPSQAAMISAFSDHPVFSVMIKSVMYGSLFLGAALFIFWRRMRMQR